MHRLLFWCLLLLAVLPLPVRAQTPDGTTSAAPADSVHVGISVSHQAPGQWRVRYRLARPVERLRFQRRQWAFRREAWEILTPGIRWSADPAEDVIEADGSRPWAEVELGFDSDARKRDREYVLTPVFTDGSEALFTGLLLVEPVVGGAALTPQATLRLEPAPGEGLVAAGERHGGPVVLAESGSGGTYVYFGGIEPVETGTVLGILDPGAPAHLVELFRSELPRIFELLNRRLGHSLPQRPTVLLAYEDSGDPGMSSSGDVMPGVVRLGFSGSDWQTETAAVRSSALQLLAHEAVHLWNHGRFVPAASTDELWLHEGGADALGWLTLYELGLLEESALRREAERALNQCLLATRGRPLREQMSHPRAPYSCGAVLNLMAGLDSAAASGLFGIWSSVFNGAAVTKGRYGPEQFFAAVADHAPGGSFPLFARQFLDQPLPDAAGAFQLELARLGAQVLPGTTGIPASIATALLGEMLAILMAGDCDGHYSVAKRERGFLLQGGPRCRALPARAVSVSGVAGVPLSDPQRAHEALVASCRDGPVSLQIGASDAVTLTCEAPLPPYLRIESLGIAFRRE